MATRVKSSQILDGTIVGSDLHSAVVVNTTGTGTFGALAVDNFTLNGTTLGLSSGNMIIDSAGDIHLDVDGQVKLDKNGVLYGNLFNSSNDFGIHVAQADQRLVVSGSDSGSPVNALILDMSASGAATFSDQVTIGGNLIHAGNLTIDAGGDITLNADGADVILADGAVDFGRFKRDAGDFVIKSETVDKDILLKGIKTGNVVVTALALDMSQDGRATFSENIAVTGNVGAVDVVASGNISAVDTTLTGTLKGPATFTIDPAVHGANSGTVIIAGDLQVDGTTTTINSTTLTVDDKNITLASGSNNKAAATGAGLTADLGSDGTATFAYDHTQDRWQMNKGLELLSGAALTVGTGTTDVGRLESVSGVLELNATTGRQIAFGNDTNGEHVRIDADGLVGIGTNDTDTIVHANKSVGTTLMRSEVAANSIVGFNIKKTGSTTQEWSIVDGQTVNGRLQIYDITDSRLDMSFDGTGKVAVGQGNPLSNFSINDDNQFGGADGQIVMNVTPSVSNTENAGIAFGTYNDNDYWKQGIFWKRVGNYGVGELHFANRGTADATTVSISDSKMVILGNGNVGIGTDSPGRLLDLRTNTTAEDPLLLIRQIGTGDAAMSFQTSTSPYGFTIGVDGSDADKFKIGTGATSVSSATKFTIDTAGNVGIGETTPQYPLHVQGSNVTSGGGLATMAVVDNGTAYNATNPGGGITFRGIYNSSGNATNFATIQGIKENATNGNYDTALRFTTRSHDGNLIEKMRIAHDGKVGIGDTTPTAKLTVENNAHGDYLYIGGSTEQNRGLLFTSAVGSLGSEYLGAKHTITAQSGGGEITIKNDSHTWLDLAPNGKVAINHGLGGGAINSQFNVFADGEAIRLDGTANTSRTLRFRNAAVNGSGNAIITSDGILQIKTEDANAHIYMNSVRDIAMQTTSLNGTAGHFTFSSYNTEIMRIDGANNRVGINTDSPNFQLHVNKGTTSYAPTNGVNENVVGFNTSYNSIGSQGTSLSVLDGNWIDGTSGADSAWGWLWSYGNETRGGLVYDHRGTERMQLWSSYGSIGLMTADSGVTDSVPTDTNQRERLTIETGGKIVSGPAIHIDAARHTATYNVTGSADAYNLMMPSFYGSGSINQTYRHAYNINTPFHTTLWQGGGGNTVFTTWSRIGAEHHKDIFIETYTLSYSDMKIKVITDANNNCSVWYAGATYQNNVYNARWRVYPLQAATVTMNPSSSQSAVYLVHAATGGSQETSTADAAAGSGPSTY